MVLAKCKRPTQTLSKRHNEFLEMNTRQEVTSKIYKIPPPPPPNHADAESGAKAQYAGVHNVGKMRGKFAN